MCWATCEISTYNLVLGLVSLGLEVEVMVEGVVAALADSSEDDGHVELAPALLINAEGRLLEDYARVNTVVEYGGCELHTLLVLLEGRMEIVGDLFEDGGHDLIALVI